MPNDKFRSHVCVYVCHGRKPAQQWKVWKKIKMRIGYKYVIKTWYYCVVLLYKDIGIEFLYCNHKHNHVPQCLTSFQGTTVKVKCKEEKYHLSTFIIAVRTWCKDALSSTHTHTVQYVLLENFGVVTRVEYFDFFYLHQWYTDFFFGMRLLLLLVMETWRRFKWIPCTILLWFTCNLSPIIFQIHCVQNEKVLSENTWWPIKIFQMSSKNKQRVLLCNSIGTFSLL